MGYKKHGKHLTLIPFALRKAGEQLVDVSKVQKGKECGCVCPSCHAPLIARKGEINQWHFAHALRGFEGNKVEQCEYSFYLSVALMAKQLFQKCDSIRLPDYIHAHSVYSRYSHQVYKRSIKLTKGRRISPGYWLADHKLNGITVDAVCQIAGLKLGIILERPDKKVLINAANFEGKRVGVVQIDLLETLRIFRNITLSRKVGGFQQALRHFLFDRIDNKQWIYYPRQEIRIAAMQQELSAQIDKDEAKIKANRAKTQIKMHTEPVFDDGTLTEAHPSDSLSIPRKPPKPEVNLGEPVRYECVLCEETWTGTERGGNPCPKCHSHLYRRSLRD